MTTARWQNFQYRDGSRLDARTDLWRRYSDETKDQWPRWVFDHLDIPAKADILELGCGTGELWVANEDRVPPGWRTTLTDISDGMLETAEKRLAKTAQAYEFKIVDAQSIPFGDECFDAVIANHMLYHITDICRALGEVKRVLRPGRKLFATTNGNDHVREIRELRQRFGSSPRWTAIPDGPGKFRLENGQNLLEAFFSSVILHRNGNKAAVDDPEPLVAYVLSHETPVDEARLRSYVKDTIDREGAFVVTRSSGMFGAGN